METVPRTAIDLNTAVIKQAILELPCPPDGMRVNDTVEKLAEKFGLSDEQKNAKNNSGNNIFYHKVQPQFRNLLKEDKLKQPGGKGTPYFHVDETPKPFPPIDPPTPDEPIEENYQNRIDELTNELLQQIRDKHPGFTVELTVSLKKTS